MISKRAQAIARLTLLAAIVAVALVGVWRIGLLNDPARAKAALQNLRQVRHLPVVFVTVYAFTAAIGVPPMVLTLAAGAVFGTRYGIIYSWIGALLGAIGGYVLARSVGGNAFRHVLGRYRDKLDDLLDRATIASLFRLRVNPIVPFNAMNFASGMAKVSFRDYVIATAFGILPAIIVYAYFADSVIAGATGARERAFLHIAIAGLVIIVLSLGPATWRRLTR
ncbi:MAG: TVP38/TMEM64 family protein [Gemmatimonadaceae bacterium]